MSDKNDFICKIPLKQHSPFIHFQVKKQEPKNELIRISELKPLIERFIKHYFEVFDSGLYTTYKNCIRDYFPKNSKKAAAYKINVRTHTTNDTTPYRKNKKVKDTAYFGDYHELQYNGLTLSLFSYWKEVLTLLKSVIPVILSCFNLGSRKSKGFGSFTPVYMKKDEFETNLIKLYKKENIFVKNNVQDFRDEVNKTYQLLKSGINYPYDKSRLYNYFKDKGMRWEKAAIKREIAGKVKEKGFPWLPLLNTSGKYPENENTDMQCYFIRALLGLAGHFTFFKEKRKGKYTVSVEHEKLKRIPSPVLFKVFTNRLYVIAAWEFYKEDYKNILGEFFSFTIKNMIKGKNSKKESIQLRLKTPTEFNLLDFLTRNLLKMGYTKI